MQRYLRYLWRGVRFTLTLPWRLPELIRTAESSIWMAPEETAHWMKAFYRRWLQVLDRAFRNFIADDSMTKASALTYTTTLTIVPLLAIALAVLKGFGKFEAVEGAVLDFFNQMLWASGAMPQTYDTVHEIVRGIFESVGRTDLGGLGVVSVVGLLLAVMSLLSRIESVMNDAWAVHKSRSIGRKLGDYLNMLVVLTLMLMAVSGTAAGAGTHIIYKFTGMLEGLNLVQVRLFTLVPYLLIWLAFIFMYFYIPNTRVQWRSAAVSGMIAGVLFQLVQLLFFLVAARIIDRYRAIYGALGVLFFLLVWVFLSWCIVLWGVEVCSAHQNLKNWRRRMRPWHGTPAERETLALRVAAVLAAPMLNPDHEGRPPDVGELADMLKLPPQPVGEMLDLFEENGLAMRTEIGCYLFARSPERVTVLDVLRMVRNGRMRVLHDNRSLLADMTLALQAALQEQTVKDLAEKPLEEVRTLSF